MHTKEARKDYDQANKERFAARKREYRLAYEAANRERLSAQRKVAYQRRKVAIKGYNKERQAQPDYQLSSYLRRVCRVYGISKEEALLFHERTKQACELCSKPWDQSERRRFNIDHNHQTNTVRGVLCDNCNYAVGHLKDNLGLARQLVSYLEKYEDAKI